MRERYDELRADEARARGDPGRRAPRRRGRSPSAVVADVREAMGVGPARSVGLRRLAVVGRDGRRPPHRLELDLDVFAGPFDLLLSLILREELDLLEVDLAEVVLAYLDHLEAARASSTSRRRPSSSC